MYSVAMATDTLVTILLTCVIWWLCCHGYKHLPVAINNKMIVSCVSLLPWLLISLSCYEWWNYE